jgi:type I restriction enzyme, R subunit
MSDVTHPTPEWHEDEISQIPALQLLVNLGWTYLSPDDALRARAGRRGRIILSEILAEQLRSLNVVQYKGAEYAFTESNIQSAIQALEDLPAEGVVRTNERVYDLLRLPKSVPQLIQGDLKSFPLSYIDWVNLDRNEFHVTEEFSVDPSGGGEPRRPDIVLFVNGIALAVIECKRPSVKEPVVEAIEQQIRNQKPDYVPRLFAYAQLLVALSPNEARYGTVGTNEKFWAVWREPIDEPHLATLVHRPIDPKVSASLFADRPRRVREYFDESAAAEDGRAITEQDRALFALCRPERLMELSHRFIIFDADEKKIARYQQFFCVKKTMSRIAAVGPDGSRQGGVVWHTQGSGKSLTMVMLATAIAEEVEPTSMKKVVLVTDRIDLDEQIWRTFLHCGFEPVRATTGKHLAKLLEDPTVPVITTVIDKFEALTKLSLKAESPDIFVLVDEGHRGQYKTLHTNMRRVLPHACFLGFTGTPLFRSEKSTVKQFGGLIDTYTINQAVADKAVVPLLYEGRDIPQEVDHNQIDRWFERITANLSREQTADLKRKFSSTSQLNKTEQKVAAIAWDASTHFADNFKGSGLKGQLVAQDKATALMYKRFFDECGLVSTEVLISAPDDREGDDDVYTENRKEVVAYWRATVGKAGRFVDELDYNRKIINAFKYAETPDIIIVVSKLLTGFDAPRNSVLYLTRSLEDYSLLQAIARVNRVYEGKDFGYVIDYAGVLHKLSAALDIYGSTLAYDPDDLDGTIADISVETVQLPQRHSDLWAVFSRVRNKRDQEEYERLLADEAVRDDFYRTLAGYARTMTVALSSAQFYETTPREKVDKFKHDLRFFEALRRSVRRRYAEAVDFREYELKIQRLLDRHVGTGEVETITPLVDIFDQAAFSRELERAGTTTSKADTIASRTAKTIREKMDDDPAFYKKFSQLLEQAIADWRAQRLSDAEYLRQAMNIQEAITDRTQEQLPISVRNDPAKRAVFSVVRETIAPYVVDKATLDMVSEEAAVAIDDVIEKRRVVNWTENADVQNRMRTEIEDELFELGSRHQVAFTLDDIDKVMEESINLGRRHKGQ